MKRLFTILLALCLAFQTLSAASALEEMTARLRTYHSISLEFTFTAGLQSMPSQPGTDEWRSTQNGSLQVMGELFKLHLPQMDILSDGTHTYQYLPGPGEINMTAVSESTEISLTTRPDLLLTGWDKYFNVTPMEAGKKEAMQVFTLTPKEDASFFKNIVLWVDTKTYLPVMLCAIMGDGGITGMSFTQVSDDKSLKSSDFKFDIKNYPQGTELIDMTF